MKTIDLVQSFLSSFTRFFGENTPQSSRHRTRAGLLIAMVLLPLLLGVLACMPVPVGDPEKSRIDPALSGIWLSSSDGEAPVMVFDPYDKRTWLVSWIYLEDKTPSVPDQVDGANHNEDTSGPTTMGLSKDQYKVTELSLFKGWLTTMEDVHFLTLEPIRFEPGAMTEYWWVFRIQSDSSNQLQLIEVNTDIESLGEVETSAEAERIIYSNLKNPELYEDQTVFQRASPNEIEVFNQLLEDFGFSHSD
jgi:hypothetical protein